jgi:4-amino-4-deoxy-L-arabinose transferase-like glycosyltransferase
MDTTPADAPALQPDPRRPALRTLVYCLVLASLSGLLMFWELGDDALTGDEAQYALVVQNIVRSGQWLYVSPYPPTPYLQKPPLYFWLTASTYKALGESEFAYRAWSALGGVGVVVLTCVLGAILFTPESGGLAGLLLMLNRSFLLVHGARSGTFDALITFLFAAAIVVYWFGTRRRLHMWIVWAAVGTLCGLASLTKPLIGTPMIALLAAHAILASRGVGFGRKALGFALGFVILAAVAAPWYVAQARHYTGFWNEMFTRNVVERAVHGVDDKHLESWHFYLAEVSKASIPFFLTIPAAILSVVSAVRGPRRSEHTLLVLTGVGWVVIFSFSASKAIHYVYPAFPVIAVMIAACAMHALKMILRTRAVRVTPRLVFVSVTPVVTFAAFIYARMLFVAIPADRSPYVPWELYRTLEPAIARGDAQVVFYGFPDAQIDWRSRLRLRARDCYYLEQMRSAAAGWPRELGELAVLLHPQKPTLIIASRQNDLRRLLDDRPLWPRMDRRFFYPHEGYAVIGVDLQPLLEPVSSSEQPSPYIQVEDAKTPRDNWRITLQPAVHGAARVEARLRFPESAPHDAVVRFVFTLETPEGPKKLDDDTARALGGIVTVSAMIEQPLLEPLGTPRAVTLALRPAGVYDTVIAQATLQDVRLVLLPHIPAEAHPRR